MSGEFPITTVVTIVVGLYDLSPCNGNTKFKEVLPTDGGLGSISMIKSHGTVRCDVRGSVGKSKVLTNSPIHGEPHI